LQEFNMSKSFGHTLGRGLGIAGALALEGVVRTAYGAGQFGKDVAEGAEQGAREKHAQLLITRAQKREAALKAREALKVQHDAAMASATMVVAPEPVVVKRGRVALG
jgi:hypothetical protein